MFVGVDRFGGDIELGNAWASEQVPGTAFLLGLRAGAILIPDLAGASDVDPGLGLELEGKLALASTGEMPADGRGSYSSTVFGWRAHLIGRLALGGGRFAPHFVAGVGGESVLTSSPFMTDDTDAAFHWGPGVSYTLGGGLDVRLDLRHGLTAGRESSLTSTFEAQLGVAKGWDWGGTPKPRRVVEEAPKDDGDADNDGVLDADDRCVDLPEVFNGFEDADGCPDVMDQDGDKIPDGNDRCPTEAETLDGVDDEDGCPDRDDDGDGLAGRLDACPDAPEDRDGYEDQDGCPDPDNDADTIQDVDDKCPELPEVFNGFQDGDGCPESLPAKLESFSRVLDGVGFEPGKARIRAASKKLLDKTAATLREFPDIRVGIEAHTDEGGTPEKDAVLSQKRADAVKWYLVEKGIAADRLETIGHGNTRPLDESGTKAAKAKNRRVEVHILLNASPPPPAPPPPAALGG